MKYILVIALVLLSVSARHHGPHGPNPLEQCAKANCSEQHDACGADDTCKETFKSCAQQNKQTKDVQAFAQCLSENELSNALWTCVQENCLNGAPQEPEFLKTMFKN